MNEDNHDEYQKGRGQNKEEYPDNIEAAGFSLQRGRYQNVVELDIVDVNLIAISPKILTSSDGRRGTALCPLHLL